MSITEDGTLIKQAGLVLPVVAFITQIAFANADTRNDRYMARADRLIASAEHAATTSEARELLLDAESKLVLGVPGDKGTEVTLLDYMAEHKGKPQLILVPLGSPGDDPSLSPDWRRAQQGLNPGENHPNGLVIMRDKGLSRDGEGDVFLHELYHSRHHHLQTGDHSPGAKTRSDQNEVEAYEFTIRNVRARRKPSRSLDALVGQVISEIPSSVLIRRGYKVTWQLPIPKPDHEQFAKAARLMSGSPKDEGIYKVLFLLMVGFKSADDNAPNPEEATRAKIALYVMSGIDKE